jgi:hypothetical protein
MIGSLKWIRHGDGWRLMNKGRNFGDVVPDKTYPGMWRCVLSGGRLSDMANLSWARSLTMDAAERELEYEARQAARQDPQKCPEKRGVFEGTSPPVSLNASKAV